jgi:hypothetical protein
MSQVDNTKAIALPVLIIVAQCLAVALTRRSLAAAFAAARADLRLTILYFGGMGGAIVSVFLLPTAAWGFAIVSALLSYTFSLVCAPGVMQKRCSALMLFTALWLAILLGLPSQVSDGIISATANPACLAWFLTSTVQQRMCAEGWLSYTTVIAIVIVIINFFGAVVTLSFWFELQGAEHDRALQVQLHHQQQQQQQGGADGLGEYQVPLTDKRE